MLVEYTVINPRPARMRSEGYCSRSVCVCVCVCVCARVLPSVCPLFFSVTAATLSVKRGHIIMHGKLRFWSGEGGGSW